MVPQYSYSPQMAFKEFQKLSEQLSGLSPIPALRMEDLPKRPLLTGAYLTLRKEIGKNNDSVTP